MYCGCGTKAGKSRWITVVVLALIGAIMWIIYGVQVQDCEICDKVPSGDPTNCQSVTAGERIDLGDNEKVIENCSVGTLIALGLIGLAAFVCATIPCCIMCCCAKGPQSSQFNTAAPAATPYIPPAGPAAYLNAGAAATPYVAPAGADYNASKPTV